MKNLIEWLKSAEYMTYQIYLTAAKNFKKDVKLTKFLRDLAEDESLHYHFISAAFDYLSEAKFDHQLDIVIDERVKKRIEAPLVEYKLFLDLKRLSKPQIMEAIIEIEYSELNEIYLYAITLLKKYSIVFQYISTRILNHKKKIINFLKDTNYDYNLISQRYELSNFWKYHILLVDQNIETQWLVKGLLRNKAMIDSADNQELALEKIKNTLYNVIIINAMTSDLYLISLLKNTIKANPGLTSNFIIYSSQDQKESREFCQRYDIPWIKTPITVSQLEALVGKKLNSVLVSV